MQHTAKCSSCGTENQINIHESINVKENPELKEKVKDGSMFVWQCPHCGTVNLALFQTLYHDPDEKLMVWLFPENNLSDSERNMVEKNMELITKQLCSDDNGLSDYVLRRVNDAGSLIEKVNIHDAGLDDVVIEMCKYVTRMELIEKESDTLKAKSIADASFKFYRFEGADNDIILTYPSDGQIQGVKIGFNVYEDCRGILKRNPAARPAAGFSKVDARWLATKMH